MKTFVLWMSLSTSAALVAVACGDSDGDGGGRGGSSGSSGASGTSGAGGTTGGSSGASTGGSAGAATGGSGGTPSGGTAGGDAGGEGGVGAEGGVGGGDAGDGPGPGAGCPTAQPTPMTMCASRGLSCDFGDTVCRCARATGNWQCFDENPSCPAMPDDGATCTGTMTACSYGEDGTCVCQNPAGPPPTPEWVCDAGLVTCPATAPMSGSSCTDFPANFACDDCTCGIGMARTWNCGGDTDMCPATAPDSTDPCPTPGLICQYTTPGPAADPTCICNLDSQWTCL